MHHLHACTGGCVGGLPASLNDTRSSDLLCQPQICGMQPYACTTAWMSLESL